MSGMQVPPNSVWSSMNYTPPRGPCNFKNGIMSGTCPCLRFMLHPVKAATSFECDGCGHHASYHNLDNPTEDAIRAKWSAQERALVSVTEQSSSTSARNKNKRRRIASQSHTDETVTIADDSSETTEGAVVSTGNTGAFSSLFSTRIPGTK